MTWHFDPATGDVYDHTGALVANLVEDYGWNKTWAGRFPTEVFRVMEDTYDNGSLSQYNQDLSRDAATENIVAGVP